MLGLGWLTIRQAQDALANGRLEEAHRLLRKPESRGHNGSSALLREVAHRLAARGEQHLEHGDLSAAWNDLAEAERIGSAPETTARLRQGLTRRGLTEARKLLEAGEPTRVLEAIQPLHEATTLQADVHLLEEVAKAWSLARELAGRGEIGRAGEAVERIRGMQPRPIAALERFRKELQERRPLFEGLVVQLHEAWAREQWNDVVKLAEQVLAVAPQHAEARKARARGWKALEPKAAAAPRSMPRGGPERRFLLWIDGVGGYLVCLGARITLGQAAPEAFVDVPLLADVSRTHATLIRDPAGYVLEGLRSVQVNGRATTKTLLQPGDKITLGRHCQMQFRQPVPVSASARLDLVSGHRLPLAVDGILLMADTLVLGPGTNVHVTIPDLEKPVVLYRNKEEIGVRYAGNLTVDGQACRERGMLGDCSKVRCDDFAFAVEQVGRTMICDERG